mmetsp:Transcript_18600/g.46423  ORF Transcript_18600/g.46423 Transcript_18600/m.46423 type:complete len:205 (+) Transcript_18600:789-1403(+)
MMFTATSIVKNMSVSTSNCENHCSPLAEMVTSPDSEPQSTTTIESTIASWTKENATYWLKNTRSIWYTCSSSSSHDSSGCGPGDKGSENGLLATDPRLLFAAVGVPRGMRRFNARLVSNIAVVRDCLADWGAAGSCFVVRVGLLETSSWCSSAEDDATRSASVVPDVPCRRNAADIKWGVEPGAEAADFSSVRSGSIATVVWCG